MAEVICPENEMEVIPPEVLLDKVMEKKEQGLRLSQACAAWVDGKYELSYSFANDETYQYQTLRIVMEKDTEVSSITAFYPYAFLYENEMKEDVYKRQIQDRSVRPLVLTRRTTLAKAPQTRSINVRSLSRSS